MTEKNREMKRTITLGTKNKFRVGGKMGKKGKSPNGF